MTPESRLIAVKTLHTRVWVFFVACIAGALYALAAFLLSGQG
jgi:hypothetical protein